MQSSSKRFERSLRHLQTSLGMSLGSGEVFSALSMGTMVRGIPRKTARVGEEAAPES